MESRKVQKTGKSTYIVSVPKDWATKAGIISGSLLFLDAQENGSLLITTNPINQTSRNIVLNVDGKIGGTLKRDIITAYVTGTHLVELRSKGFSFQQREDIITITKKLMGFEIMEESDTRIIIQDFSNPDEISLDKGFRRLCIIVQSLLMNTIQAAKNNDAPLASDTVSRCDDINRLHYLILKQFMHIFRHSRISKKNELGLMDAFYYRLTSDKLERIAYNACKIVRTLKEFDGNLPDKIAMEIGDIGMISHELVRTSIDSILKPDASLANKVIDHDWKIEERLYDLKQSSLGLHASPAISIGIMADSLKRIEEHAMNIAEFALELSQTRRELVVS